MPTESYSWGPYGNGPFASASQDTGDVVTDATVTSIGPSYSGTLNYSGPTGTPYGGGSWLFLANRGGSSSQNLNMNFADDPSDATNTGVFDARFVVGDIDAGSGFSGYQDRITVSATDLNGDPLTVTATPNSTFTVTNNADGSVTLAGLPGSNSGDSSPFTWSIVSVSGGPIGNISVNYSNNPNGAPQHIYISDIFYETREVDVICFAAGTTIRTARGERPVEKLRVGDLVVTRDNGLQPLAWIGHSRVSARDLARKSKLVPIRIRKGVLGAGFPLSDLIVSPQHRVLVRSVIARRMFDEDELLIPAVRLLGLEGVERAEDLEEVVYYHLLLARHEIVYSNGAETESLYIGKQTLRTLSSAARAEIAELFPALLEEGMRPAAARPLIEGKMARRFTERHQRNDKPLVC